MRKVIFFVILFFFTSLSFGKNVVIFEFYNKEGNNIPTASVGVLKSILQFTKFFPNARISDSSFDVKNRNVKDIIKAVPGYDNYIIGFYSYKNNVYYYNVSIYDSSGETLTTFSASSEDLFDIADSLMSKIFSFYSGKTTGFATLELQLDVAVGKRYTIILNDEVLTSTTKTNISLRIISKVPYNILVREDDTKEVVYNKSIVLVDNETVKLVIQPEEVNFSKGDTQKSVESEELLREIFIKDLYEKVKNKLILDDKVFADIRRKIDIVPVSIRDVIYREYSLPIGITILACGLNVVPGLGSLIIGDDGGVAVSLLTPYISMGILVQLDENSPLKVVFGIITLVGYGYNLVRPLIYQYYWNNRLKETLKLDRVSYIHLDASKISLNIRF